MISSVRSFGAPLIEPAGNAARMQSIASASGRSRPRTTVIIWCTVACDSTTISPGTSTLPSSRHAAEVVAHEVGDHQVLGAGLASRRSSAAAQASAIGSGRRAAVPFIGRDSTVAVAVDAQEALGRGAEHGHVAEPQQRRERRRVAGAQRAVGGERVERAVAAQLGRQADLVALALEDLALGGLDVGEVGLRRRRGARSAASRRRGRRAGAAPARARARESRPVAASQASASSTAVVVGERDEVDARSRWSNAIRRSHSTSPASGSGERCARAAPHSALSSKPR